MQNLSSQLSSVDQQVEALRKEFEKSMKEATQIKIDLDREEAAIRTAGTMVDRLGGEYQRWEAQMALLQTELDQVSARGWAEGPRQLDLHCALGAAFATFLGVEPFDSRERVVPHWERACGLAGFDVVAFLTPEAEQQRWRGLGLPATRMAAENAAILFAGTETPFLVDPAGAALAFLRRLHPDCLLLKPTQEDFLTQVELGVRFGKVVLVDEVYALEPALAPLLRKAFLSQGPRRVCQLGDKQVEVADSFRLFLCTRSEQVRLPGFVRNAVALVNFSTTLAGLSSQVSWPGPRTGLAADPQPGPEHRAARAGAAVGAAGRRGRGAQHPAH